MEVLFSLNARHAPYRPSKTFFRSNWVQKTETFISEISRTLFSNMDFSFAHFANINLLILKLKKVLG